MKWNFLEQEFNLVKQMPFYGGALPPFLRTISGFGPTVGPRVCL